MMIVPAVMILLGKAAWYMPKWLDKILPNIDIEGESKRVGKRNEEIIIISPASYALAGLFSATDFVRCCLTDENGYLHIVVKL